MIYVLEIDNKVISALKENRLKYKNLLLAYVESIDYDYDFIIAVLNNENTRQYDAPKNNEIKFLLYNEEKNNSFCIYDKIFRVMKDVIDFDYQYLTIDDFSLVNH